MVNYANIPTYDMTTGNSGSHSKVAQDTYRRITEANEQERDRPYAFARYQMKQQEGENAKDRQWEERLFNEYTARKDIDREYDKEVTDRQLDIEELKAKKDLLNASVDRQTKILTAINSGAQNFNYW